MAPFFPSVAPPLIMSQHISFSTSISTYALVIIFVSSKELLSFILRIVCVCFFVFNLGAMYHIKLILCLFHMQMITDSFLRDWKSDSGSKVYKAY